MTETNRGSEEDCLGLGFSSANSSQTIVNSIPPKPKPNTIEFYFQQAFSHQNQPHFQQKQEQARKIYCQNRNNPNELQQQKTQQECENNVQKSHHHNSSQNIEQVIKNAQAIAFKFRTQSTPNDPSNPLLNDNHDSLSNERPLFKQELIQFEESFQLRLKKAFLKNLEYISRKDEEALQIQLQNLEQSKEYDTLLEQNSTLVYKERQKLIYGDKKDTNKATLSTKAGIGTGIRKRQSKKERNQVYGHIEDCRKKNSLYVTGIRTQSYGEKNTNRTEHDIHNDLCRLFESYGCIHKVKLYKNHKSGHLKGDGLVMYDQNVDLASICIQVNGAELPCGSVLEVQPASFDTGSSSMKAYKSNFQSESNTGILPEDCKVLEPMHEYANGQSNSSSNYVPDAKNQDLSEDDLDEFFDSLV